MSTDYSFFEQSLTQQRTYSVKTGWHCDRFVLDRIARIHINKLDVRAHIEVLSMVEEDDDDEAREVCRVKGSHVMRVGSSDGVERIQQAFDITLPPAVDDFYRRWNGGFLLFREFYELLSVDEIIKETLSWDEMLGRPTDGPRIAIPFCTVLGDCYLALRKTDEGEWEVIIFGPEEAGVLLQDRHEAGPGFTKDPNFPAWLKRMCQTDGWPISEGFSGMLGDDPPAEQVG